MAHQIQVPTIFNNVMGPVGAGPSTSNTCGPCRIGYMSRKLFTGPLQKVVIHFPSDSAYATPNCKGMRSDYAFAHGLLGRLPDSGEELLKAFDDLKAQNTQLHFTIDEGFQGGQHLLSVLELTGENGETAEVWGISKGGGIIELTKIDGFPLSLGGEVNTLLVFTKESRCEQLEALAEKIKKEHPLLQEYPFTLSTKEDGGLIIFSTYVLASNEIIRKIEENENVIKVRALPALLPVVVKPQPQLPFANAAELAAYCEDKTLVEAALDYESAVSGWDRERVLTYTKEILSAMRNSVASGLKPGLRFDGIVKPAAGALMKKYSTTPLIGDGIVTKAALYSMAIMEYSNASGVVVCMPTAGASGTVAGALLAAAEQLSSSDEQLVEALLSAGAIGVSIAEDNDFCGGVYGCQAEVGCASCMAAAGLVSLMGGNAVQMLRAASMALQNMLGLICDPVCGLVQVPCFARNMSGIANAIVSANMCLLGFDPTIPLQGAFEAMKSTGASLPAALKGCGGGLCTTEKACELLTRYNLSLQ